MNTKLYLKQAWELLKQNRLFSTLYIVGTALAIAMTMMMAVIYYVRLAPVYPEERRGTTLYMGGLKLSQTFDNGGWAWWTNGYSHRAVTEWFRPLEDAAVVSGYYNAWSGAAYVQRPDGREDEPVKVRLSGLITSRMESRLAEMGIRKTFGAWRNTLLNMVLWENLLLTFIGGLIGLVTAWICLFLGRGWVFTILDSYATRVQGDAAYGGFARRVARL